MNAHDIIMVATINEEANCEMRVVLKKGYRKEFIAKIARVFEDKDKRMDLIIEFVSSQNTTNFPSDSEKFEAPVEEIKSISDL